MTAVRPECETLEAKLLAWADLTEKSTDFMADPEHVEEATEEVALLRAAAAALAAAPDARLAEALEWVERRTTKPSGVITNEWYWDTVHAVNAAVRAALAAAREGTRSGGDTDE